MASHFGIWIGIPFLEWRFGFFGGDVWSLIYSDVGFAFTLSYTGIEESRLLVSVSAMSTNEMNAVAGFPRLASPESIKRQGSGMGAVCCFSFRRV